MTVRESRQKEKLATMLKNNTSVAFCGHQFYALMRCTSTDCVCLCLTTYQVRGKSAEGWSEYSDTVTATTRHICQLLMRLL